MSISIKQNGEKIHISIDSETPKDKMVTGVFDIPFASDFESSADKKDVKLKKVTDYRTGNTHLFVDLGRLEKGHTDVEITLQGKARTLISAECIKDGFGAMWYGDHAYLRSVDRDAAIQVKFRAPDCAYVLLHSGEKIKPENGMLKFVMNATGINEAPMLCGYARDAFELALKDMEVCVLGATKCRRWWYERDKKKKELEDK